LSPEDREVLLLTYWDGFSSREIRLTEHSATAIGCACRPVKHWPTWPRG
jgi:hypothetical protein